MPLSTLKVPSSIGFFFVMSFFMGTAVFTFIGSKNAKKGSKMPSILVLFKFRQLFFYDSPPPKKKASKYPKIAIMKIDIFYPSYFNVFYMLPRQYF